MVLGDQESADGLHSLGTYCAMRVTRSESRWSSVRAENGEDLKCGDGCAFAYTVGRAGWGGLSWEMCAGEAGVGSRV
jgi:hypothetical protein